MATSDNIKNLISQRFEECIGLEEFQSNLANSIPMTCYNGYEPSGKLHLAAAIPQILNFNYLCSLGIKCKILLADVFALNNNKLEGDMDKITQSAQHIKDTLYHYGLNREVQFIIASHEIAKRPTEYWNLVMQISREVTQSRIARCGKIMGRSDSDALKASQFLYPIMQCADIFFYAEENSTMICSLGTDQRKVNMLAREIAPLIDRKSPIIFSHAMLPGLKQNQEKMSKSDATSAIYMDDDRSSVELKIKKAYCPEKICESNPIMKYFERVVFPWFSTVQIENIGEVKTFGELKELYQANSITPQALKACFTKYVLTILQL